LPTDVRADGSGRVVSDPADTGPDGRAGDQPGWDEFAPLYDEHHERLYRVALLLCHGDAEQAQDAVAETFLRVYQRWAAGEVESFFPYARQTLVTQVLGRQRDEAPGGGGRPSRRERRRGGAIDDGSSTFQLLEQLDPTQRTAVVLRYFEDLSYDQIAATMGVTSGAAKADVAVGLQRLRALMGES
jgi:RNA polymerase sigma factor (sigma-70 family)